MAKSIFFTILLATISILSLQAQPKYFTGTITYSITYPANATGPVISALPSTLEMSIAANKCKFELTLPNGKQAFIINGDETSVTRLMEMTEGKFYIKKTKEDFLNKEAPTITPLKETKTIAGYKCSSADVSTTDRGGKVQKSKVYYSEELGNNNIYFNTIARGIKGLLLEGDYSGLGINMHLIATQINPGRVSNKTFEIPSDYTETTEAKLQQLKQARKTK
jgi:hypothetical protein